jgi:O-antigen/teichoic acid export membrane protein
LYFREIGRDDCLRENHGREGFELESVDADETGRPVVPSLRGAYPGHGLSRPQRQAGVLLRKMVSNFVFLGMAELACRGVSFLVSLMLLNRLGQGGFGRIEFSFNVVVWLVLIVRDCFETIVTREIARHPRLTRGLVNRVLAVKLSLAVGMLALLLVGGRILFTSDVDRYVLWFYGLLLLTTALGLDFVFRGQESMGLVAISLVSRTAIYCLSVTYFVTDATGVVLVPVCLAAGEFGGIALVWGVYLYRYGLPRPMVGGRFLTAMLRRGQAVGLIHLCQAVIMSGDLLVVGLLNSWEGVGLYSAPLRIITAVMGFGLIFQQVVFPALSRSLRDSPEAGRALLNLAVRVLVTGLLPIAIGGSLLADPLVRFLFSSADGSAILLALGIWRAPLLGLAFLYQASLISMNREAAGVRVVFWGSAASVPLIWAFHQILGLPGASLAVLVAGSGLVLAGYVSLAREGRAPSAHHHLGKPLVASAVMAFVCVWASRIHVTAAVFAGALTYVVVLELIGGLDFLRIDWGRAGVASEGAGGEKDWRPHQRDRTGRSRGIVVRKGAKVGPRQKGDAVDR